MYIRKLAKDMHTGNEYKSLLLLAEMNADLMCFDNDDSDDNDNNNETDNGDGSDDEIARTVRSIR